MAEEKNFKKKIDNIFWDFYASAYDDIAKYYEPYKQLMKEIIGFIQTDVKKASVILDAGCGTGEISINLAKKGFKMHSIDISNAMLKVFEGKIKKMKLNNLSINKGDLNKKLAYKNSFFNAVINVHSLFMMDNIYFTLNEFNRVLKTKGYLIIAHPRPIKLFKVAKMLLKDEGFFNGISAILRLLRVAFFNIFLSRLHKKVYGEIPAQNIIDFFKVRKFKLILQKQAYYNIDTLIILKK